MQPNELIDHLWRKRLVEKIEQKISLSPAVREAFLLVPRHRFVEAYYQQQERQLAWSLVPAAPEIVYEDRALVTKVDARGMPSSSSSLPSLMAEMLEALHIQPGQKVLEVGTGTGYNSALLAHLLGDAKLVTTIEIDPALARVAEERLISLGYEDVRVYIGNGLEGVRERAPFARILATGGVTHIPQAWIEQLEPGGMVIANLLMPLSHGVAVVQRQPDGTVQGRLLAIPNIAFMQLKEQVDALQPLQGGIRFPAYEQQSVWVEEEITPDRCAPGVFRDPTFLFFLQLQCPQLEIRYIQANREASSSVPVWEKYLLDQQTYASVRVPSDDHPEASPWQVLARGSYDLWARIETAYREWIGLRQPPLDAYHFEFETAERQSLVLPAAGLRWEIPHDRRRTQPNE